MAIVVTMLMMISAGAIMRFALTGKAQQRAGVRKAGAIMLALGMITTLAATFLTPPAQAGTFGGFTPEDDTVTMTEGGEDCHGIVPTPGSANTDKLIDPDAEQDLTPGGTVSYLITFPTNANNVGDFEIVDCVLLIGPGGAPKDYKQVLGQVSFHKVNNSADFELAFEFAIPEDAANGDQICNVAKTTASPSKSPGSNRKAGPACFVIGGSGRVEKHDAATGIDGDPIDGATFLIDGCILGAGADGRIQPIFVSLEDAEGNSLPVPDELAPDPVSGLVEGTVSAAVIAFNGPSGSSCDVTEIEAPNGYNLPDEEDRTVTVEIGANRQTTFVFLDTAIPTDLTLTKLADSDTVNAGETIGYTITISNGAGAATAQDVVISDVLPVGDGLSWSIDTAVTADGIGCAIVAGTLTCNFGELAAGASRSVHITSPTTLASCAAHQNLATVASSNSEEVDPASDTTTVLCPGLNLTKTADGLLVKAGDQIGFTVTVSNNGEGAADPVIINDTLPTGDGIAWSISPEVTGCDITDGNQLTCTLALAAGDIQEIHVVSDTNPNSCGSYLNVVSMTALGAAPDAEALATVQCPLVTLTKTATPPTPVNAGEPVGFVITVINTGLASADAVVVSDTLPSGDGLTWSIAAGRDGALCDLTGDALTCAFGDLTTGQSRSVHLTSPTTAADCAVIPNTASAALDNGAAPADATATVTVICPALTLGKTADAASVDAGQPIGFTLTVSNGPDAGTATAVTLTDELLAGDGVTWSVDPASADADVCSLAGTTLTCTFGDLVAGADRSVHVLSPTTLASCKAYDNTARLSATNASPMEASASTTAICPEPEPLVEVFPATIERPAPLVAAPLVAAPPAPEVLGVVQELPRTGSNAVHLVRLAGIALMLGALAIMAGNRRPRFQKRRVS